METAIDTLNSDEFEELAAYLKIDTIDMTDAQILAAIETLLIESASHK